ncbi:MAG: hypothetical protein V5B38_18985 [Candidatus Accumulibacter propinquus]|jgi:hypothetical protein
MSKLQLFASHLPDGKATIGPTRGLIPRRLAEYAGRGTGRESRKPASRTPGNPTIGSDALR